MSDTTLKRFLPDLPPLRIVSYSVTASAGAAAVLARCIAARTNHRCRCIWATNRSRAGIRYPSDIEWTESTDAAVAAEAELSAADLVVVHNGQVDPRHAPLLADKPVITMAHMWTADHQFVQQGYPGVVLGQYHVVLQDYRGWAKVPNPIPLWDDDYRMEAKPEKVSIAYTPSDKWERYPRGHSQYWASKGYSETMAVLDGLARRNHVQLEVVRDKQVSHKESLAMKRRSHIVIDECITGSYHRNSLEGLAAGCVVVNGLGLLEGVPEAFRYCASFALSVPFEFSDIHRLGAVLEGLIEAGPERLEATGRRNREWMEHHWDFEKQWGFYWVPVVRQAMERGRSS